MKSDCSWFEFVNYDIAEIIVFGYLLLVLGSAAGIHKLNPPQMDSSAGNMHIVQYYVVAR